MNIISIIEHRIKTIIESLQPTDFSNSDIDTLKWLYDLAMKPDWGESEYDQVDYLSRQLDIHGKLLTGYSYNRHKQDANELIEIDWLELLVAILLKAAILSKKNSAVQISVKRFNVLFKAIDIVKPEWLAKGTELEKEIGLALDSLLNTLPIAPSVIDANSGRVQSINKIADFEILPLTVLFYEGPIARAYLETIKCLGFKSEKIIEIVPSKDLTTKKTLGKWFPFGMRKAYAASIQRNKIHYWPKVLLRKYPDLVNHIKTRVSQEFEFGEAVIDNANSLLPLSEYCENVEALLIAGLSDNHLLDYLNDQPKGTILFTGGGIMPTSLLDLNHLNYLHVHPGYLPNIRGADCALWSSLLTGHTSASCFYLSPGIDMGKIIESCWLPKLSFNYDVSNLNSHTLYRAVYSFIDPWVRAVVLRDVLSSHASFENIKSTPQTLEAGITFHFMHEKLKQYCLHRIFS